jgi:HEAT repeat protein
MPEDGDNEGFESPDMFEQSAHVTLEELLGALRSEEALTTAQHLRLSMTSPAERVSVLALLDQLPADRLQALYEDLQDLADSNYLVDFESIFEQGLHSDSPVVRRLSLRGLQNSDTEALVPKFIQALQDDDADVRAEAAETLGGWIMMGELEEMDEGLFQAAQAALLGAAAPGGNARIRRSALESLGYSSRPEVVPLIESAYAGGDEDWRASALLAMGRSADPRWTEYILDSLDHANNEIRRQAAAAAGALFLEDATGPLLNLLADEDRQVRQAAAWSLSEIGGEGVREALEGLLSLAEDEDEIEEIAGAIENLLFNQGMDDLGLMSLDPDDLDLLDDED